MKKLKLDCIFAGLAMLSMLASCHKDKMAPDTNNPAISQNGIYILNQGDGYGGSLKYNSTLTYYNYVPKTLIPDRYSAANGKPIGGDGNDVEIYGSKMYLLASTSNVIDIVDPKTSKLIKQDSLVNDNIAPSFYLHFKEPRSIAFYKGNAFITTYDGIIPVDGTVAVMDTATLEITKYIPVGSYPEGSVVVNDKLYVAAPGAGADNIISVIDLNTLTVIKKIAVIPNPVNLVADAYGNVYVTSYYDAIFNVTRQTYPDPPTIGGLTIIDSKTDLVKSQKAMSLAGNVPIAVQGDFVYYATLDGKIAVYNAKTQSLVSDNFITDGTLLTSPFAITVSAATGEVFISDAKNYISNGTLNAFDKTGKLEYTLTTGINPGKILLLNK
jgi:YVTN family beta-propeller protein